MTNQEQAKIDEEIKKTIEDISTMLLEKFAPEHQDTILKECRNFIIKHYESERDSLLKAAEGLSVKIQVLNG